MFDAPALRLYFGRLPALILLLGAVGCGFKLAGTAALPAELESIHLVLRNFDDSQSEALQNRLRRAGASLVAADDAAALRLTVTLKVLPRRTLVSSAGSGKTVERIARGLEFSLNRADGTQMASKSLRQQRDFTLDEDNLLASTEERKDVVQDLEQALFNQLIHQLKRIQAG